MRHEEEEEEGRKSRSLLSDSLAASEAPGSRNGVLAVPESTLWYCILKRACTSLES